MTPELRDLLQRGKLDQTCPTCGVTEAAGAYCTACVWNLSDTVPHVTWTGPAFWHPIRRSERQRAAARAAGARISQSKSPRRAA